MTSGETAFAPPNHPRLNSLRALLALIAQLIFQPQRGPELDRLFERAERLLAQTMFELAARMAGRTDLLATHEARLTYRRGAFHFSVCEKLSGLPPFAQMIVRRRTAHAIARYRRALGCRHRASAKRSVIRARAQRRSQSVASTRAVACARSSHHTPARIAAPP